MWVTPFDTLPPRFPVFKTNFNMQNWIMTLSPFQGHCAFIPYSVSRSNDDQNNSRVDDKEIFQWLKNVDLCNEKLHHQTISTCQMTQYSFEICHSNPYWSRIFTVQILFYKVNTEEVYLRHWAEIQLDMEVESGRTSIGVFTHNRLGLTTASSDMEEAHPHSYSRLFWRNRRPNLHKLNLLVSSLYLAFMQFK